MDDDMKETEMAYFTKNLGISTVIYTTVPIEYPTTSSDGVAQFLVFKDGKITWMLLMM